MLASGLSLTGSELSYLSSNSDSRSDSSLLEISEHVEGLSDCHFPELEFSIQSSTENSNFEESAVAKRCFLIGHGQSHHVEIF